MMNTPHQISRNVHFQRMVVKYDPSRTQIFSTIMNVIKNNLYYVTLLVLKGILKYTIKSGAVCSSIPVSGIADFLILNARQLKDF